MTGRSAVRGISSFGGRAAFGAALAAALFVVAGTGVEAVPLSSSAGVLSIADVQTFSGSTASFGPEQNSGCLVAAAIINAHGGVMGHHLTCVPVDTRSDVVDSVPAVQKVISTTKGLVGAVGPSSTTASADVPLLNAAHIPMFADTGQTEFTKKFFKYFYRIIAADDSDGFAYVILAKEEGFKKIGAVYVNNSSNEGAVPGILAAVKFLHLKLAVKQAIAPDQTSYNSEVLALQHSGAQVIVGTMDPQTAATYLTDLKNLTGKLLPYYSEHSAAEPVFKKALEGAIGKAAFIKYYRSIHPASVIGGPAFALFKKTLLTLSIPDPKQWVNDPYAQAPYDAVNYMALAMLEAHSTTPSVYAPYIVDVANPGRGKEVVHSFVQGRAAIAAGHKIRYVGIYQDVVLNKFHDSTGGFVVTKLKPPATTQPISTISSAQVARVSGGSHG
jgi:ABC-type branched-subunit amino acid transport system substrate-binding protein